MKKSFSIMALTVALTLMTGMAMADSVDIGLGQMDRAEFEALRQMVAGEFQPSDSVTTKVSADESYVAEFSQRDVESIRQAMTRGGDTTTSLAAAPSGSQVDIGLGSMSTSEFCDLNKLVASNTAGHNGGFTYICP